MVPEDVAKSYFIFVFLLHFVLLHVKLCSEFTKIFFVLFYKCNQIFIVEAVKLIILELQKEF